MPSSAHARAILTAISPRLAIRSLWIMQLSAVSFQLSAVRMPARLAFLEERLEALASVGRYPLPGDRVGRGRHRLVDRCIPHGCDESFGRGNGVGARGQDFVHDAVYRPIH